MAFEIEFLGKCLGKAKGWDAMDNYSMVFYRPELTDKAYTALGVEKVDSVKIKCLTVYFDTGKYYMTFFDTKTGSSKEYTYTYSINWLLFSELPDIKS